MALFLFLAFVAATFLTHLILEVPELLTVSIIQLFWGRLRVAREVGG